jgi:hypothetical protein
MIIQSSQINQESSHTLSVQHEEKAYRRETVVPAGQGALHVTLTGEARAMAEIRAIGAATREASVPNIPAVNGPPEEIAAALEAAPSAKDEAKLDILLRTMEQITGKKYRYSKIGVALHKTTGSKPSADRPDTYRPPMQRPESGEEAPDIRMRLVETYSKVTHSEEEATSVSISGAVKTADGREISLDIGLTMSREYYEESTEYSLTLAPLTDPLVVNYDGNTADLTESKYTFDLNMDGTPESISFVSPGSGGFIALDRNRDGIVNDGGELFGALTGNGFGELSVFDEDGNGWIDDGDSIYVDLSIWEKDGQGKDRLLALADTGIGAIYLNAVESPFRITGTDNETLGQVRATGVYLKEDGGTGTVQQIDLAT